MAVQSEASDVVEAAGPYDRAKALSAFKLGDVTFYWITRLSAISVLLILGGIIISLIIGAWPAMKEYGFAFLWTQRWAPSADPPVLGALGPMYGTLVTSFIASLILAIMVLPFITSISVDVFKTVPPVLKEAAYGVGCTTWEVVRNVVIPYTRVGVIGGIMLALGRALGETMAVTFIIGNSFRISSSVFAPGTTISAAIASEFAESDGLHQSGLILLGLLLFVLTFFVLAAARLMLLRLEKKAGN